MTNKEIIKELTQLREYLDSLGNDKMVETLDKIIKSLGEKQCTILQG